MSGGPIRGGDTTSRAQELVYEHQAEEYDALISAEDADGHLADALLAKMPAHAFDLADVGAGTGRLSRILGPRAKSIHLIDRAKPMLEVARRRLASLAHVDVAFHEADARALPMGDASVDVAAAGWVFGHFRHWMPDGWRDEVAAALAEMRRVVRPGGTILVIETLGTGHEVPRRHEGLDEYFAVLESSGFTRTWVRTDYVFPDVDTAVRICGAFFGEALVARIREREWSRVPECTGIFAATRP